MFVIFTFFSEYLISKEIQTLITETGEISIP